MQKLGHFCRLATCLEKAFTQPTWFFLVIYDLKLSKFFDEFQVTKSANYCYTMAGEGLLLLCDVALGEVQLEKDAKDIKKPKRGKNSVKGVVWHPEFCHHFLIIYFQELVAFNRIRRRVNVWATVVCPAESR